MWAVCVEWPKIQHVNIQTDTIMYMHAVGL